MALAGAEIGAGVLILAAAWQVWAGAATGTETRFLWLAAIGYVAALTLMDAAQNGVDGFAQGMRATWVTLALPATATLATPRSRGVTLQLLQYGFAIAAIVFLHDFATVDPAVEGRYGFHTAPYAFAIMLAAPSWLAMIRHRIRFLDVAVWIVLAVAIFLVNTRGVILAWLAGSALFLAFFPRGQRIPRRFLVLLVLLIAIFGVWKAQRWQLTDLAHQHSIQQRFAIWSQVLDEFADNPIFGHGFGRFRADPSRVDEPYRNYLENQTNPHSGYLMMLHAGGMIGFLLLWALYGSVFFLLLRRARSGGGEVIALVAASNIVAMMIGAFSDKTFFMTLPALENWFLAGLAIGIDGRGTRDEGGSSA